MQIDNAQKVVEDSTSHSIVYEERPLFDIVNDIMVHTMLPRLAIIRILNGLSDDARNKINNQDYLEEAIKVIEDTLIKFKSSHFLTAELISGEGASEKDIFEVDKIGNDDDMRHIFRPKPERRKAINLVYKFDSDGEVTFAKSLDSDPNVLLYTKLKKGGFVIETPVGDYSPDWAIVYQKPNDTVALYFIAETKWDKDAGDLNEDERIKIKCAKKHFTAVNDSIRETVNYAWVNGYMDGSKSQSFPQVFIDDHYTDSMTLFESNN